MKVDYKTKYLKYKRKYLKYKKNIFNSRISGGSDGEWYTFEGEGIEEGIEYNNNQGRFRRKIYPNYYQYGLWNNDTKEIVWDLDYYDEGWGNEEEEEGGDGEYNEDEYGREWDGEEWGEGDEEEEGGDGEYNEDEYGREGDGEEWGEGNGEEWGEEGVDEEYNEDEYNEDEYNEGEGDGEEWGYEGEEEGGDGEDEEDYKAGNWGLGYDGPPSPSSSSEGSHYDYEEEWPPSDLSGVGAETVQFPEDEFKSTLEIPRLGKNIHPDIKTMGLEYETKLLVVGADPSNYFEKISYTLRNNNETDKNKYSLEGYHSRNLDIDDAVFEPNTTYAIEFIYGVFQHLQEAVSCLKHFKDTIKKALEADKPTLEIVNKCGEIVELPIVKIDKFEDLSEQNNLYTNCYLEDNIREPGVAVYWGPHINIFARSQITIGITLETTNKLFSFILSRELDFINGNRRNNFRILRVQMASYILYHKLFSDPPDDLEVNIICFEIIYIIVNQIHAKNMKHEYLKQFISIKPRTNIGCLVSQLDENQQIIFNEWWDENALFLNNYITKTKGIIFNEDQPENNISKKIIYSYDSLIYYAPMNEEWLQEYKYNDIFSIEEVYVIEGDSLPKLHVKWDEENEVPVFGSSNIPSGFSSLNVLEWYHPLHQEGETYNILEIRELEMFDGNNVLPLDHIDTGFQEFIYQIQKIARYKQINLFGYRDYYEDNFDNYLKSLNEDQNEEISNIIDYIKNIDAYFL